MRVKAVERSEFIQGHTALCGQVSIGFGLLGGSVVQQTGSPQASPWSVAESQIHVVVDVMPQTR